MIKRETLLAGNVWRGDFINRKKNGEEFWENASISPIKNDTGEITHFVAVKEDITERKRMEQELLEAKIAADDANKAKGDFLANMSHEIRTPMNAVKFTESGMNGHVTKPIDPDQLFTTLQKWIKPVDQRENGRQALELILSSSYSRMKLFKSHMKFLTYIRISFFWPLLSFPVFPQLSDRQYSIYRCY